MQVRPMMLTPSAVPLTVSVTELIFGPLEWTSFFFLLQIVFTAILVFTQETISCLQEKKSHVSVEVFYSSTTRKSRFWAVTETMVSVKHFCGEAYSSTAKKCRRSTGCLVKIVFSLSPVNRASGVVFYRHAATIPSVRMSTIAKPHR